MCGYRVIKTKKQRRKKLYNKREEECNDRNGKEEGIRNFKKERSTRERERERKDMRTNRTQETKNIN